MTDQVRLKTYMSPVFFKQPANPCDHNYELYPLPDKGKQKCLLDELLGGGIVIPKSVIETINIQEKKNPGLLTLLSGRPGSGKSTFSLELCYRLACNPNPDLKTIANIGLSSVFISAESATSDIIEQANSFGWEKSDRIKPWSSSGNDSNEPCVFVIGRDAFPSTKDPNPKSFFSSVYNEWQRLNTKPFPPHIIVLDSLNVIPKSWPPEEILDALLNKCLRGPIMLVAILDSHSNKSPEDDYWSHISDLLIELSYTKEEDYLVRKIQIVKARYQDHADGEHQLKINAKTSPEENVQHAMSPLIKEGGIFVFPSVHRSLSIERRRSKERKKRLNNPLPTPFSSLNNIIYRAGLPAASCTAIVGSRGGMKSHLAYYTMLKFLYDHPKERALLISLRDEEDSAKETLIEILTKQLSEDGNPWHDQVKDDEDARKLLEKYLDDDRLEILFFWPGYISPEEFFHLVEVSLERRHEGGNPVSLVVVNGLEQLNARFPLCAKEKMFVSGLVTMLTVCGTTNIIVSGGSLSLPPDMGGVPAGLLQMADLIIESSFQLLPKNRVWSDEIWRGEDGRDWTDVLRYKQYQPEPGAIQDEPHVVYQIIREPGARECRSRVLFYMGRNEDKLPLKEGSVTVTLLPENFPYGKRL